MTPAQFGKLIGQTRQSVIQGIDRGRLPEELFQIDSSGIRRKIKILNAEEAKRIWFEDRDERTIPAHVDRGEKKQTKSKLKQTKLSSEQRAITLPDVLGGIIPARADSAAIIEAAKAEQEVLKLQTEKGLRLERKLIEQTFGQVFTGLKNDLGGIPSELKSQHPDIELEVLESLKGLINDALRKVGSGWKQ